ALDEHARVGARREADERAALVEPSLEDDLEPRAALAERERLALVQSSLRPDERLPQPGLALLEQERLGLAARRRPSAEEARREDGGLVQDEDVARAQEAREVAEDVVRERARPAVEDEESREVALLCGRVGDEMRRELEVEEREVHAQCRKCRTPVKTM